MKPDSSSTVTMDDNEEDEMEHEMETPRILVSGRMSPAFITVENEKGVLEHVQV